MRIDVQRVRDRQLLVHNVAAPVRLADFDPQVDDLFLLDADFAAFEEDLAFVRGLESGFGQAVVVEGFVAGAVVCVGRAVCEAENGTVDALPRWILQDGIFGVVAQFDVVGDVSEVLGKVYVGWLTAPLDLGSHPGAEPLSEAVAAIGHDPVVVGAVPLGHPVPLEFLSWWHRVVERHA
jgi:hypothetical protein